MKSNNLLFVPMRVDALNLSTNRTVVSPIADFSQLPFVEMNANQQQDRNPNTAFVSEAIMSSPFQNVNLTLAKGIHLHWSLPDTLTKSGGNSEFPAVPNRWMVARRNLDTQKIEARWIVESDTFLPESTPLIPGFTNMPLPYQADRVGKSYRYMGTNTELSKWKATPKAKDSWSDHWKKPLTAVGYGHPLFASFYPNCMGVFGAWDLPQNISYEGIQYEVIGWYEDTENDILNKHNSNFVTKTQEIHQQPITQQFLDRGHLVWGQLFKQGLATPIKAAVHIPKSLFLFEETKNKKKSDDNTLDDCQRFLNPSPIRRLIRKEQFNKAEFIKKAATRFHLDLVAIWPKILGKKGTKDNWLTSLNSSIGTINLDKVEMHNLSGRGKVWNNILSTIFKDPINQTVVATNDKYNKKPSVKKYWKTLSKNGFIIPINTTQAFVSDAVASDTKILKGIKKGDVAAVVKELTTDLTPAISRDAIEKQFPKIFRDQLWKSLVKNGLIEIEINADEIDSSGIMAPELTSKWKSLDLCYQDAIPELKTLFNSSDNATVLSQERISDRYGLGNKKPIWDVLKAGHWIKSITGNSTFGIILKKMADAPSKSITIEANKIINPIDDLKSALALKALSTDFQNLILTDVTDYFLFHGHEKNSVVNKIDFDNRFGLKSKVNWSTLIENGYIHNIELSPTEKLNNYKAPVKGITQNSDLDFYCRDLYKKGQPLTLSSVLTAFKADDLWSNYFKNGWLIYDVGQVLPKSSRETIAKKYKTQQAQIEELIPTEIQKQTFINRFGKEQGLAIWKALITQKLIFPSGMMEKNAPIPRTIDLSKFKKNPDLAEKENEVLELLKPVINRQFVIDHFQENGAAIWEELLTKNWLEGQVSPSGELKTKKPWNTATSFGKNQEIAKRSIQLAIKKDTLKSIEKDLNWSLGISLNTKNINKDLLTELEIKGWIAEKGQTSALLEPEENREPLSPQFYHLLPTLRQWMDAAILKTPLPNGICCFGKVKLSSESNMENSALKKPEVEVTVGNTSTEALSCFLANKMNPTNPKKAKDVEEQLEAIQLERKMNGQQLDLSSKFKELRHEKEFRAQDGGRIWQIVLENEKDGDQKIETAEQADLSISLAHKLNELNSLQKQYEVSQAEIADMKKQLFSDWYKYQLCVYPPAHAADDYPNIDEVKTFIERFDLLPLEAQKQLTGDLEILKTGEKITSAKALHNNTDGIVGKTYAAQVAQKVNQLISDLSAENTAAQKLDKSTSYTLKQIPGPRFWEPTDPAILIEGNLMKSNLRHGKDGRLRTDKRLQCYLSEKAQGDFEKDSFNTANIEKFINELEKTFEQNGQKDSIAFNSIIRQPWNTLTLEWEVDFQAVNDPETKLGYEHDFITKQFTLPANQPEFAPKDPNAEVHANSYYTHNSILTDFVKPHFSTILKNFIENRIKKNEQALALWNESDFKNLLKNDTVKMSSSLTNAINALKELNNTDFMSQNLSGFNHELLMQKQTLQLPVADPLAFSNSYVDPSGKNESGINSGDYFAERVKDAVGKSNFVAPEPQNEFNPIRAGRLAINKLRLIDTYGQICDLKLKNLIKPADMADKMDEDRVRLHPRLAQPTRLNFRWLSAQTGAKGDDMEMNAHPATSPIIGWVVPNYLDDSLFVYDSTGEQLLEFNENNELKTPPFNKNGTVQTILNRLQKMNSHLYEFCNYLNKRSSNSEHPEPGFLKNFISGINSSLEQINPEYFSRHKDLALLMGRPIALVRVSVGIEHKGLPAVNQDWTIFRNDVRKAFEKNKKFQPGKLGNMIRKTRETHGTDKVKFPIRIGDYLQLNDGLVGYWDKEKIDTAEFVFPYVKEEKEAQYIHRNMFEGNRTVTLLFDPTAKLHATSGILPTKTIDIPEDQYLNALRKIKVSFLAAPILTERGKLQIPVPKETGQKWNWEGNIGDDWVESPYIDQMTFAQEWQRVDWKNNALDLWQFLDEEVKSIIPTKDEIKCTLQPLTNAMWDLIQTDRTWGKSSQEIYSFLGQLSTIEKDGFVGLDQFVKLWVNTRKKSEQEFAKDLWAYLALPEIGWITLHKNNATIVEAANRKQASLKGVSGEDLKMIQSFMSQVDTKTPLTLSRFVALFLQAKGMELSNDLWTNLVQLNWLTGNGKTKHIALSQNQRETYKVPEGTKLYNSGFESYITEISDVLEAHGKDIEPVRQEAGFHGQQEIRDGWLTLSKKTPVKWLPKAEKIVQKGLIVDISFNEDGLVDGNDLQAKKRVSYLYDKNAIRQSTDEPLNPFKYYYNFSLTSPKMPYLRAQVNKTPGAGQCLTYDFWVKDTVPKPTVVAQVYAFSIDDENGQPIIAARPNRKKITPIIQLVLPNKTNSNEGSWKYGVTKDEVTKFRTSEEIPYNSEQWNHWTIVMNGQGVGWGETEIYLNGKIFNFNQFDPLTRDQVLGRWANFFDFGTEAMADGSVNPEGFLGKLSRWRIWGSSLSYKEVIALHLNDINQ